jgi:hypothetical protein
MTKGKIMRHETFYIIAAQILRQRKDCRFKPVRKCLPIESDAECRICIAEKIKLARAVK